MTDTRDPHDELGWTRLMSVMRESVVITDADLAAPGPRIVYVNRGFETLTGYTREEVLGRSPRLLQGPLTSRSELARLRSSLARGEAFQGETINYRKNGSEYRVLWYVEPYRAEPDGPVTHFVAVQRDITESARARHAEQLMGAAMARIRDGIAVLDRRGHIRFANEEFCSLVCLPVEDLMGRRLFGSELVRRAGVDRREVIRAFRRDGAWSAAVRGPTGTLCDASLTVIASGGFLLTMRDATERQRVEAIAANLNFTDNLGLVFAGIRHELGNPINSLKTALRVLIDGLDRFERSKVLHYLTRMHDEVGKVEYLLRALRSFGALEVPEHSIVDLEGFLEDFVELVRRDYALAGVDVELALEHDLKVRGDERALQLVLLNLCNNAVQAMEGCSTRRLSLSARRTRNTVEIRVSDTGVGMSAHQMALAFKPFQTTKPKGTGMGLVIVQRLVSQMRGVVSLTSEEGVGTTFVLAMEQP